MYPKIVPPFNNRSFCYYLLFLITFFSKDIFKNEQKEKLEYHYSLECYECCLLGHDFWGRRILIFTQVDTFLRWLNENEKLSRRLIYKKAKVGQVLRFRFLLAEGLWVPQCWQHFRNGNQCGPPRSDWQHLSSFYAYHLAYRSFSLNVFFFLLRLSFFMSMEVVGKGSCPLCWRVYQKASNVNLVMLTCEWHSGRPSLNDP